MRIDTIEVSTSPASPIAGSARAGPIAYLQRLVIRMPSQQIEEMNSLIEQLACRNLSNFRLQDYALLSLLWFTKPSRQSVPINSILISRNQSCLAPGHCVLTFDDGPAGKVTDDLLAILHEFGVKACFCLVGC